MLKRISLIIILSVVSTQICKAPSSKDYDGDAFRIIRELQEEAKRKKAEKALSDARKLVQTAVSQIKKNEDLKSSASEALRLIEVSLKVLLIEEEIAVRKKIEQDALSNSISLRENAARTRDIIIQKALIDAEILSRTESENAEQESRRVIEAKINAILQAVFLKNDEQISRLKLEAERNTVFKDVLLQLEIDLRKVIERIALSENDWLRQESIRVKNSIAEKALSDTRMLVQSAAARIVGNITPGPHAAEILKLMETLDQVIVAGPETVDSLVPDTNRESLCSICMEERSTHAFVPCGHKVVCEGCASTFTRSSNRCPICRISCTSVIRIFDQ